MFSFEHDLGKHSLLSKQQNPKQAVKLDGQIIVYKYQPQINFNLHQVKA